jgi:hypothetical protein
MPTKQTKRHDLLIEDSVPPHAPMELTPHDEDPAVPYSALTMGGIRLILHDDELRELAERIPKYLAQKKTKHHRVSWKTKQGMP